MSRLSALVALPLSLTCIAAQADTPAPDPTMSTSVHYYRGSSGPLVTVDGRIVLGYSDVNVSGSDPFRYALLDAEGEIAFDSANTFGLGFDIRFLSNLDDKPFEYIDVYGFYNVMPGSQLQAGYAQPASDLFLTDRTLEFGGLNEITQQLGSLFFDPVVRRLSFGDNPALGLSYFGDYGMIEVSASAHFNQEGDGAVYGVGLQYNVNSMIELFAGGEFLDSDTAPDGDAHYWLGGRYTAGDLSAEAFVIGGGLNFDPDARAAIVAAYYDLPAVDGLTLGGRFSHFENGGDNIDFTRIGAEYTVANGLTIGGHVERVNATTDATLYGVEVGFRF